MAELEFLLLQIRDAEDPIRMQEIGCFAKAIGCEETAISTLDLLTEQVAEARLKNFDAVLIGGSGNYSAAGDSQWLQRVLADLRLLCDLKKPTFASCWGFQAIARALGGRCIHDPKNAELGTIEMCRTEAAKTDPLFGMLDETFLALAGHEDHVIELPSDCLLYTSPSPRDRTRSRMPSSA